MKWKENERLVNKAGQTKQKIRKIAWWSSLALGTETSATDDILSRHSNVLKCHTNDDRRAWFAIDPGVLTRPKTLQHAGGMTGVLLGVGNCKGVRTDGENASGQTDYLSIFGLEIYGQVTGVCEELGSSV